MPLIILILCGVFLQRSLYYLLGFSNYEASVIAWLVLIALILMTILGPLMDKLKPPKPPEP